MNIDSEYIYTRVYTYAQGNGIMDRYNETDNLDSHITHGQMRTMEPEHDGRGGGGEGRATTSGGAAAGAGSSLRSISRLTNRHVSGVKKPLTTSSMNASSMAVRRVVNAALCPICAEPVKEAFLTPCGHTFCHGCLIKHLRASSRSVCVHK